MSSYRYLMAVDPSLTCSGWAIFSVRDEKLCSIGTIKGAPPSHPMPERLLGIQRNIEALCSKVGLGESDVLVCEAPTTVRDPHNALKVEQVRTIFESVARSRSVTVPGRVNPRSVQYEVMGLRGKQLRRAEVKASAVKTVEFLYSACFERLGLRKDGDSLKRYQDIVDAVLIGRLALTRLQAARDGDLPLEEMFRVAPQGARRSWRVKSCGI